MVKCTFLVREQLGGELKFTKIATGMCAENNASMKESTLASANPQCIGSGLANNDS